MSSHNPNEVFTGGATTSQHIEAEDDDHFNNTTFKLKRTRSLGLLDEFINPLEKSDDSKTDDVHQDTSENAIESTDDVSATNVTNTDEHNEHNENNDKRLSINTDVEKRPVSAATPKSADHQDVEAPSFTSPEFVPHDDSDIAREPSIHVDYFSHQWDVSDISKSWRYIIQKRKDVANSARLENASWRTWAQRRLNLKTINPEELNWSKENDITWLYGPIVKEEEESDDEDDHPPHSNTATSKVAGDISIPTKNKGILKKRSVQDMMISHANLVKLEAMKNRLKMEKERRKEKIRQYYEAQGHKRNNLNEPPEFDDYDAISQKLNSQYRVSSNQNSSVNLSNLSKQISNLNLGESNTAEPPNKSASVASVETSSSSKKDRHIHFNDVVQQCIAVDVIDDADSYDSNVSDDDDEDYDYDEYKSQSYILDREESVDSEEESDDEDGGFFLKVRSPSNSGSVPPLINKDRAKIDPSPVSQDTDSISTTSSKIYRTIQPLPSTSLNYGSEEESSDEENPYTSSLSHNVNSSSSRGYDYYYDYNTVYTVAPQGQNNQPDVIDLPEDLAPYSSYESQDNSFPIIDSQVINNNNMIYNTTSNDSNNLIVSPTALAVPRRGFNFEGDSSSESEDEGLSISTRSSSQSLAQQAYKSMTPAHESIGYNPAPVEESTSSINPRQSSTGLSKQSTSSNSLSSQFFGTTPKESSSLADLFFNTEKSPAYAQTTQKSSPLPPHTTSANAFLGNTTPPLERQKSSTFNFDSDSDEDEFIENADTHITDSNSYESYNLLSQVAGKNRIGEDKNIVNQAKGLANHFLGNWKHDKE